MRTQLFSAAVLLVGAGTASAAWLDRDVPPRARETGKPVACVSIHNIRSTSVHGDSTIDFRMVSGKIYRNRLGASCPTLGFEERFQLKSSTGQLCSGDIITVLQPPGLSAGPSCGLGSFQPIELAK